MFDLSRLEPDGFADPLESEERDLEMMPRSYEQGRSAALQVQVRRVASCIESVYIGAEHSWQESPFVSSYFIS